MNGLHIGSNSGCKGGAEMEEESIKTPVLQFYLWQRINVLRRAALQECSFKE